MADDTRINGNQYGFASIILKLKEERYSGVTAISYGDSRERSKAYGMGRAQRPRGRTRGKYVTEPVTMRMHKDSAQVFLQALADEGDGTNYGDTEFEVAVQFIEEGVGTINVDLEQCVVMKVTDSAEEGPDALMTELELDTMAIRRNGLTLFAADN